MRGSAGKWSHLYTTSRWRKARARFLANYPLCSFCERVGRVEPSTVVDHATPHKGDMALFWDEGNWQALCKRCHDSDKQRIDAGQVVKQIGLDGWPV